MAALQLLLLGLLAEQVLPSRRRRIAHGLRSAKGRETLVEEPLHRRLDGLVEQRGQEGDDGQAQPDGGPRPHHLVLDVLHGPARVPHDAVDREGGQAHRGEALEDAPLHHDGAPVLQGRDGARLRGVHGDAREPGDLFLPGGELELRVQDALVVPVGAVALVRDVSQDVDPRDAIGSAHEVRVSDGSEGFADVRSIGDVAMGREENRPGPRGVGSVSHVCLSRIRPAVSKERGGTGN